MLGREKGEVRRGKGEGGIEGGREGEERIEGGREGRGEEG